MVSWFAYIITPKKFWSMDSDQIQLHKCVWETKRPTMDIIGDTANISK